MSPVSTEEQCGPVSEILLSPLFCPSTHLPSTHVFASATFSRPFQMLACELISVFFHYLFFLSATYLQNCDSPSKLAPNVAASIYLSLRGKVTSPET